MSRTIDTHTHVLADEAIKRLQKEIPSLGLKLTPLDADNSVLEVAGVPYKPFPKGGHDIARRLADMDAGAGRHAGAVGDAADLALRPGSVRRRRAVGDPERRHGAAGQGASGSFRRHRHLADAGAATGRRRIAPRHDQARHARRHDRLQYQRQESRRSELRAALGDRGRARRVHGDPSRQCRRRRPAARLLSQQSDRQSARHHDRGGVFDLRRRARAPSQAQFRHGAWRRLHSLSGHALGPRLGRAAGAESASETFAGKISRPLPLRHHPAFQEDARNADRDGRRRPHLPRQRLSLRHGHARLRAARAVGLDITEGASRKDFARATRRKFSPRSA